MELLELEDVQFVSLLIYLDNSPQGACGVG
jgi:hypothetical protein